MPKKGKSSEKSVRGKRKIEASIAFLADLETAGIEDIATSPPRFLRGHHEKALEKIQLVGHDLPLDTLRSFLTSKRGRRTPSK